MKHFLGLLVRDKAKIFSLEMKSQELGQEGKDGLCIVVSMLRLQRAPMLSTWNLLVYEKLFP